QQDPCIDVTGNDDGSNGVVGLVVMVLDDGRCGGNCRQVKIAIAIQITDSRREGNLAKRVVNFACECAVAIVQEHSDSRLGCGDQVRAAVAVEIAGSNAARTVSNVIV